MRWSSGSKIKKLTILGEWGEGNLQCEEGAAPPAPPSHDSADGWTKAPATNCYDGHGATDIDPEEKPYINGKIDDCKRACAEDERCMGVMIHGKHSENGKSSSPGFLGSRTRSHAAPPCDAARP